jgi:large subunit ribosomal protein L18
MATSEKSVARARRRRRVRRRVRGTEQRPRLCVFRSNRHMYAQVISDESGRTLAAASTVAFAGEPTATKSAARKVGEYIGALCQERHISQVVFDRNGFIYHGRVKEVADGARAAGLKF